MLILKIIFILIIIILFYLIIKENIENFINEDFNNLNDDIIISSLPYDIKCKNKELYYYDYSNNEYEKKIKTLFNIYNNINHIIYYIEGNEWYPWDKPDKKIINKYYNYILEFVKNKLVNTDIFDLPKDKNKVVIIKNNFIRFKRNKNNDNLLFDIDLVFYRNKKPLARHFKFIIVIDNDNIKIIYSKLIGVINKYMVKKNIIKSNNFYDYFNYKSFNNIINIDYDDDINNDKVNDDEKIHTVIENKIYNNLIKCNTDKKDIDDNDDLTKNNNYTKEMIKIRNGFLDKLKE